MRDLKVSILSSLTVPLFFAGAATAQVLNPVDFQPRNDAGLGSIKRAFNATQLTNFPEISCNNEPKACALTAAIWHKGRFWVFGREGWTANLAEHYVFEWTGNGTYVGRHVLPIPPDTDDESVLGGNAYSEPNTAPELRDLDTDEAAGGDTVLVGTEEGVYLIRWNVAQRKWELTNQIMTGNGPRMLANNPIRGEGLSKLRALGTPELPALPASVAPTINHEGEGMLAVGYDPNGDNGNGSLYVGCDYGTQGDGRGAFSDPDFRSCCVGGLIARFDANGDAVVPWQEPDANTVNTYWLEMETSRTPILEVDLEGTVIRTLVNNPNTDVTDVDDLDGDGDTMEPNPYFGEPWGGWWCSGGITIDPLTGNLWVGVDERERILEVDVNTGMPTGVVINQPPAIVNANGLPNRQGGITGIPLGDPGTYPSFWDMIPFTNVAGDDFFTIFRMHQYPGLNGTKESFLEGSVDTLPLSGKIFEPATASPIAYTSESTLKIDFNSNGGGSAPALLMFDLNDDVNTDAETSLALGLLPELRVHSAFSTPADNGLAFQFPWSTGNTLVLDLNAVGFRVETGQQIRVQGVYFDPRSQYSPGLMVTNEVWFGGVGINTVLIETRGTDTFNADTSQGYFRVKWLDGPDIVNVKFNLEDSESNSTDLNDAYWNTSVPNMADVFMLGSGAGPGCQGTYRNDSDAVTGLVYDPNVNTNPIASGLDSAICDYYFEQGLQTDSGFILTVNSYVQCCPWDSQTLEFNFTDFGLDGAGNPAAGPETFEFDCTTYALNGTQGGFFQGMIVEITLSDGTMFKGELLPDPLNSDRAFIAW